MMDRQILDDRYSACRIVLVERGQEHVLRWWDTLDSLQRGRLLADIESIPWPLLDGILPTHVLSTPTQSLATELQPAVVHPSEPPAGKEDSYQAARILGERMLRQGEVAAFTVAGGQGTRLGVDGPKGIVGVTPIRKKSLFQLFAEMVLAARRRYGSAIPWYVMTSPANHAATTDYFCKHKWFGLPQEDVVLFSQGMLPAFDFSGRLLLADRHSLALAPDGHGGSLKALATSGALDDLRRRGITTISYFQVDNPLVQPFDRLFLGLHAELGSEMSTKAARKADDLEKVGNLCLSNGRLTVIEYSDFPAALAHARNADGSRTFDAGNLAIHLIDVEFIDRVVGRSFQLPFRRAEKAVPFVDERGDLVRPEKPNAVKLETFVFDVLPLASNPLVLEVDRSEEFSPVKNATGVDSLETSRRDQVARGRRWLSMSGVDVVDAIPSCDEISVEISPLFALDADELKSKRSRVSSACRQSQVYLG